MSERGVKLRRTGLLLTAISLSAFLLFSLELYAGRVVLPVFGGSPSVWTTALCFFTGVVFLGYLYSHFLVTRMSRRWADLTHLALVGAALAAAVFAPSNLTALRLEGLPPALNVLVVLAAIAGLPAFLLSTTTPLLSARFAEGGNDPWWLYAASNAASLVGLLAYPFVIEPYMPLSNQRTSATLALATLGAVLVALIVDGARSHRAPRPTASPSPHLSRRRQGIWLLAACMPAGLLSATTMHLTTDHISSPLLWIGPLGIYLGSFVIAFSERGRKVLPLAEKLVPAAATLMWIPYFARVNWPVPVLVPLLLGCYAVLAVAIHGQLALDRPSDEHLTRFYVIVSAGGLLATAFVALVAPLVFDDVYEYPLLIIAALAALALLSPAARPALPAVPGATVKAAGARLAPFAVVGVLLVAAMAPISGSSAVFVAVLLLIGSQAIVFGRSPRSLAVASAVTILGVLLLFAPHSVDRVRTFFGITEIREAANGQAYSEIHGTTLHGLQYTDAHRRDEPTAYFVRSGPLGDVMRDLDARLPGGATVGVVGLGVGTVAAYARPGDAMTFFEIDRSVIELAYNSRYFSYLADAPIEPTVILGDGRLSLEAERTETFDLLLLDAFSSDAVPAHLLTREAMDGYLRTLRPGGLIAFQLTNRHFDLVGAVSSTAGALGLEARTRTYRPDPGEVHRLSAQPSTWLVVGAREDIARFETYGWLHTESGPVLTDDYSDVMRLLRGF